MSEYPTDEMIEKAAKAAYLVDYPSREWADENAVVKHEYRLRATGGLNAATPLIAAKALRDAAGSSIPRGALALETRSWLRARAEQIESGS